MKDNNKQTENKNSEDKQEVKTITSEIKTLFDSGLNTEQIKAKLKENGINKSNHYIRNITYRLRLREGLIKPQQEQQESIKEQSIIIKIFENDEHNLILYVKTCKEFEEWLKANKEIRQTANLWGLNENGEFYHLSLENDSNLDDINSSILRGNRKIALNRAILRCKGISEGLTFNLRDFGLIHQDSLKIVVKNFIKSYSEFYNREILNKKINIIGEVLIQNEK